MGAASSAELRRRSYSPDAPSSTASEGALTARVVRQPIRCAESANLRAMCHHARMRRQLGWLIAVPLAVIGTLAGHAVGYWAAVPDAHERAHVLASSGHGYLEYAPLLVSLCVALVALGFLASARCRLPRPWGSRRNRRIALVAALAPIAFMLQEVIERYAYDGHVYWGLFVSAPFLLGLATQLPFGLLAAAIAFALASAAHGVGQAIRTARPPPAGAIATASCPGSQSIPARSASLPAATRGAGLRCSPSRVGAAALGRRSKRGEMHDHPSRRSCRLVLVAVAAVLAALVMVPAAGAHARLITTEPANDAVLEQSPRFGAAPVRRAGGDGVRRDPRLRRTGTPGRLG